VQKLRNSLEMNTHTMISHMSETAREAVYKANSSLFDGYKFLATLDFQTCVVCGADDGKIFRTLEEASKPPLHLRCRCVLLPYIRGFEDIEGERAAMDGPVSDKMTYKDWFKTLAPEQQEEILGKYRYQAYKNGVSIDAFVPDGRKLSLAELQQKEGLPFYKTLSGKQREEFQEQSNAVYSDLTNSQRASLHEYTTGAHNQVNGALYGLEPTNPFVQDAIDDIEQAMDKFSSGYNMTLFSGTNRAHYEGWKAGETHNIAGYVSTSVTRKPAERFYKREEKRGNPLMLEIRAPKGTRGIYIGDNTGFPHSQNEFLLGKGLRYQVIDNSGDTIILEVIK
jgi:SPP1 gp7 family putative phage head morphogenesis protein